MTHTTPLRLANHIGAPPARFLASLTAALLTAGGLAAATATAQATDTPTDKCAGTVVPGTMKIDIPDIDLKGRQAAEPSGFTDEGTFTNTDYAGHGDLEIGIKAPKGAKKGDKFWIDLDDASVYGYSYIRPTAPDGTVIATPSIERIPGQPGDQRFILTWTDYVETHQDVTASFRNYVYARSDAYPDGFPREKTAGRITACDGTSLDTSVRSDGIYNMATMNNSWASTNPSDLSAAYWSTPSQTDSNLLTVSFTAPDYLAFSGAAPTVGISQWSEHYAGSADNDAILDWRGLVTAQTKVTLVDHVPTTPGQAQAAISPDRHTMTITAMVDKNEGLYVRDFHWARSTSQAWRETGGVPIVITEQGTTSVAKASFTKTPAPIIGDADGDGSLLLKVVPAAPSVQSDPKCGVRPEVVVPKTEGVTYTKKASGDGSTVTVTATTQPGYRIPADTTKQWTLTIPKAEPCPVDAVLAKTWDEGAKAWTITVANPSKDAPTKPVKVTDDVKLVGADGKTVDLKGETVQDLTVGTVEGAVWSVPALKPGQKATATVKAKPAWLAGNGGRLTNQLIPGDGTKCEGDACVTVTTPIDVDPTLEKTWDEDTSSWTLTVTNPSKDVPARPLTLRDNLVLTGKDGKTVDLDGETITLDGEGNGKVNEDGSWTTPRLEPGQSVTATVKADPTWLEGDGTLTNHLGRDGDTQCLTDASQASEDCGLSTVPQTPKTPEAPEAPEVKGDTLARTGAAIGGLLATAAGLTGAGVMILHRRQG